MSKIVITLDTETKEAEMTVDGQETEFVDLCIYHWEEGFDFRAYLKPEKVGDITKQSSLVAYAKEFTTKSFASVKFLDDKRSLAMVEEKKTSEKLTDWISENLK